MPNYFKYFPKLEYDIKGRRRSKYMLVTNILFRVQFVHGIMDNISAYYEHLIQEGETPEILAEKVYGDPEAHWIILLANDIVNPLFDWPLTYDQFDEYIVDKYGSIDNAATTIHHYEMVVQREESSSGVVSEFRYVVNEANVANSMAETTVPYDHYGNLAETAEVATTNNIEFGTGTVTEIRYREAITNLDYEQEQNDKKRSIKIIKPEYYSQIVEEFKRKSGYSRRFSLDRRLNY